MRGADRQTAAMFSYLSPEAMVPSGHPLRLIRPIVNAALERLSRDFDKLYSSFDRVGHTFVRQLSARRQPKPV